MSCGASDSINELFIVYDYVDGSIIFRSHLVLDPDSLSTGYVHTNMFSFKKDEMSILALF